jgi:hypothetical protein
VCLLLRSSTFSWSSLTAVIATNLATVPAGEGSALVLAKAIIGHFYGASALPGNPAEVPTTKPTTASATTGDQSGLLDVVVLDVSGTQKRVAVHGPRRRPPLNRCAERSCGIRGLRAVQHRY